MKNFFKPLRNQRGSAILYSVFLMSLLVFIALEVSKDAAVEYEASLNAVRRVQAYHAADACISQSLLRIKAYQQAVRSIGKSLPDPSMLDLIWQFPLAWPISPPKDMSEGNKSSLESVVKQSVFKNQFSSKIATESGKIDINDLASPAKGIREKTQKQILDLFQSKLRDQSDWSKKYYNYRFEDLIKHLTDWIDADRNSLVGGDEGSYYSDRRSLYLPPNQPFKTMEELHMVELMEDEIYDVLAPQITLYGGKGININYAAEDMLMALDPQITKEVAAEIIKRRSDPNLGGFFKTDQEFFGFINGLGVRTENFNEEKIPLYFDHEINFNISCIGLAGKVTTEVIAVVYDFQKVQNRLKKAMAATTADDKPECQNLVDDAKYDCLCKDKAANEKSKCVADQKAAATKKQDQGQEAPLPPGPPYVFFKDIR